MSKHLSESVVRQIACMLSKSDIPEKEIAELFSISETTVRGIRTGAFYSRVTGIEHTPIRRYPKRRSLTDQERAKTLRLASDGVRVAEIEKVLGRDNETDPPKYDVIARCVREARKRGEIPPESTPLGRPLGKGKPRKVYPKLDQQRKLSEIGDSRVFRSQRMKQHEIRNVVRYILDQMRV